MKTRRRSTWGGTLSRGRRRPSMPEFPSTCASGVAADAAHNRCKVFKMMKLVNKLQKRRMPAAMLEQLCGSGAAIR